MNKVFYILSFINNYRNKVFKVFYYELFNLVKYLEITYLVNINNSSKYTDTVPCVYYFLHKIKKFIKKYKIKSVADLGSGYGRITNYISKETKIKVYGIEYNLDTFNKSKLVKAKNVNLYHGNILKFPYSKYKFHCYILNDPLKKKKDLNFLLNKILSVKKKKKIVITININRKLINKNFKLIKSVVAGNIKELNFFTCK